MDGLCACGCGKKTPLATRTRRYLGTVRGQPLRIIPGHSGRKAVEYVIEDCGYKTPCWVWQLHTIRGYGRKAINRHPVCAHRWYYEQAKGPIPEGFTIDHLCRNPSCVNPDHLQAVTMAENMHRGLRTKLSSCTALQVRLLWAFTTLSQRDIADLFAVTQPTVSDILRGKTWALV